MVDGWGAKVAMAVAGTVGEASFQVASDRTTCQPSN